MRSGHPVRESDDKHRQANPPRHRMGGPVATLIFSGSSVDKFSPTPFTGQLVS